jgi:hypothetical protein
MRRSGSSEAIDTGVLEFVPGSQNRQHDVRFFEDLVVTVEGGAPASSRAASSESADMARTIEGTPPQ